MTRYCATSRGNIPFTAEEELQYDRAEKEWLDAAPIRTLESLRTERNRLLAETDYFALSDVTMTAEMTTYRQALRDLPANTDDVFNPVYPEKPQ